MKDRVTDYAKAVAGGGIVSGDLHRLACQRHLDDLGRDGLVWDASAAAEAIAYAEQLVVIEGFKSRKVTLLGSQAFDVGCTFGWKNPDGFRRFRRRYKSVARQNGKTFENGILGTYLAAFSGYQHGKLFTVATKHRQARLVWDEMRKFITGDPELAEYFDVKDYKSLITAVNTSCTIEALSREGGLDDGFRSIFASIDEIHQHRDNRIYKALYNGTRSLDETLVSMITTRGDDINSFCKEMDDYCVSILRGTASADDFFVDIYSLDEGDDAFDPAVWIKANPYLATTRKGLDTLATDAQTARDMGGMDLRDFLAKCVNLWVENADDTFIPHTIWRSCGSGQTLEDFKGYPCFVGLDLSSGGDLTTLCLEFPTTDDGAFVYSHSFMPRGRVLEHIETDIAPYDVWEKSGLVTVTGSDADFKNDYKFIIRHLAELKEQHGLVFAGIGVDPHNADGILSDLEAFGCPVMVVVQSCRSLNDATEDIQLLAKSGKLGYDRANELLSWSVMNSVVVRNSFDEKKVDKKDSRFKRIDPVDAMIDAHAARLKLRQEPEIDLGNEMDRYLDTMGWR